MVRCGGCDQDVNEICGDHGTQAIRDPGSLHYFCNGGGGPHGGTAPHYAICVTKGVLSHYLTVHPSEQ